ncbi:MAG TPA: PepSY-associated TM helix domain-containing protein, partial [Blastocatellia bacterium]|nr:PepSY-associated TM helix domain-containing protein [Blastocatellia bacterium]
MKRFRKVLFWCHLSAGVIAGLVILIMSITGALLAFQPQIERFADRDARTVQPPQGEAPRLSTQALFAKVREARPDLKPTGLTLQSDPTAAAAFALGRDGILYVNPYTGDVTGESAKGVRSFFQVVTDWHRWLGTSGDGRATGRAITGACNAAFLFLAISGLYIWWPKKWTRKSLSSITVFKRGLQGRARDFNWHNVTGFWCALVLVILTATGMVMSYQWANNLLYTMTGSPVPQAAQPQGGGSANQSANQSALEVPANLDQLLSRAQEQTPQWESVNMRLPMRSDAPTSFTFRGIGEWNPIASSQVTIDPATTEVVRSEPYASLSLGRRLRTWARTTHTGEAGRLPGQI